MGMWDYVAKSVAILPVTNFAFSYICYTYIYYIRMYILSAMISTLSQVSAVLKRCQLPVFLQWVALQ